MTRPRFADRLVVLHRFTILAGPTRVFTEHNGQRNGRGEVDENFSLDDQQRHGQKNDRQSPKESPERDRDQYDQRTNPKCFTNHGGCNELPFDRRG